MARVLISRLLEYLQANDGFSDRLFGFRRNRSTGAYLRTSHIYASPWRNVMNSLLCLRY